MNDSTISLTAEDPAARAAVAGAVAELLERRSGTPRLTIRLSGQTLPADFVAALVAGLRRMREVGGAIAVEPLTTPLGDAMALYGLDRVFALPLDPDAEPRTRRRRWFPRAAVAVLALLATIAGARPVPVSADERAALDPAAIIARVIERNPELSTYQGRMHVDVRMISFPFIREHLDATTYYKRPSNYEVVFDRVPAYARGFEKLYTDIGDPSDWERRFVISPDGTASFAGHTDLALRLVQRVRGMIDHETVLVDPQTWSIDQIRYDYYNGGSITMSQSFHSVAGYQLLATQRADIAIPHVRAVAYGTYDDYQTNVAVDDAVFHRN
jgi:hypothetical protein